MTAGYGSDLQSLLGAVLAWADDRHRLTDLAVQRGSLERAFLEVADAGPPGPENHPRTTGRKESSGDNDPRPTGLPDLCGDRLLPSGLARARASDSPAAESFPSRALLRNLDR